MPACLIYGRNYTAGEGSNLAAGTCEEKRWHRRTEEMTWRLDWTRGKVAIAKRLASGECDGGYPEAVLLIGAVISALAAEWWPGRGIDRQRFVELLIAAQPGAASTISTPLLVEFLRKIEKRDVAERLRVARGLTEKSLVVSGEEVDGSESDAVKAAPGVDLLRLTQTQLFLFALWRAAFILRARVSRRLSRRVRSDDATASARELRQSHSGRRDWRAVDTHARTISD